MFRYLNEFRKRRAIRRYATAVRTALLLDVGRRKHYSVSAVKNAVGRTGSSDDFICYAFAMYCSQAVFDRYHGERGEQCDYDRMREDIEAVAPAVHDRDGQEEPDAASRVPGAEDSDDDGDDDGPDSDVSDTDQ